MSENYSGRSRASFKQGFIWWGGELIADDLCLEICNKVFADRYHMTLQYIHCPVVLPGKLNANLTRFAYVRAVFVRMRFSGVF